MDQLRRAYYEVVFERDFIKKKGAAFQDFFSEIMGKGYPEDFIRTRPWGRSGDRKNDGYLKSRRILFQVVFVSSPWIFLTKLGIIEPVLSLFQQVHIPVSVSNEILSKPDESANIMKELQKNRQVDILKARNIRLVDALGNRLGRGEAEAIAIAIEMDADVVCLDDYPARSEAIRLGLEVKGTLGIIRRLMELQTSIIDCTLSAITSGDH